jgi:23S rRNA (cytosine1962-C5)-methyltransferase
VLLDALAELLAPRAIVLRNDIGSRGLEGLEQGVELACGTLPPRVEIREGPLRFAVSPMDGQKTGWYFDQRQNRERLARYAHGARVLDVFSYSGGFGIGAAVAGAAAVTCVDTSARALDLLRENARLNRVETRVRAEAGDAFETLRALAESAERFDVIVIDPPAFVARKKDLAQGTEAYRRINRLACSLLAGNGILLSASCSSHLDRDRFRELLHRAAVAEGKRLRILEQGHQGPDHPIHPALPESEYLKAFLVRVGTP